MMGTGQMT